MRAGASGLLDAAACSVLLVDFQERLAPAMADAASSLAAAVRLAQAAALLGVPVLRTEQNPARLGGTLPSLAGSGPVLSKTSFDATRAPGFAAAIPDRPFVLVAGWEAHVCVLQTAFGLMAAGRKVAVVADATDSRSPASREAGLARLAAAGAAIVTVEMAVFEWLGASDHPQFRAALGLIK